MQLRQWARRTQGPVLNLLRTGRLVFQDALRTPTWVYRLIEYRFCGDSADFPVVGVHTVFLAKENILFLKEWILYHKLKGIDHFFLYDNTGSTPSSPTVEASPHTVNGRVSKYDVPYDDLVCLSESEISDVLHEIQQEIPNVTLVRWEPTDEDGNVRHAQVEALNDALKRYGEVVDWMVFMDMDEFLVSDMPIPELCKWLESHGFDGGLMTEQVMSTRFDNLDQYVTESEKAFAEPYPPAPKYLCNVRRTTHAEVHSFRSRSRQYRFCPSTLYFLHYKMPSRHHDMRERFKRTETGINPALEADMKSIAGNYCSPEWRLSVSHPEWRRLMGQVNPWWHMRDRQA